MMLVIKAIFKLISTKSSKRIQYIQESQILKFTFNKLPLLILESNSSRLSSNFNKSQRRLRLQYILENNSKWICFKRIVIINLLFTTRPSLNKILENVNNWSKNHRRLFNLQLFIIHLLTHPLRYHFNPVKNMSHQLSKCHLTKMVNQL